MSSKKITTKKKVDGEVEKEIKQTNHKPFDLLKKNQLFFALLVLVVLLGGLVLYMAALFNHANDSSGELETTTANITFDKKTIEQIKELNKFDERNLTVDTSQGRINPFADN